MSKQRKKAAKAKKETPPPCPHCKGEKTLLILHRGTGEHHNVACACTHTLPVPFVYQQPDNAGCCIAAAAMIVQKSYFEVKQLLNAAHDLSTQGLHSWAIDEIFDHYGFAVQRRSEYLNRLNTKRAVWPCAPWADLHWVEVINTRGSGQHAVVLLRDGRVLDPWWGVMQGLHRYPRVVSMAAVYPVAIPEKVAA